MILSFGGMFDVRELKVILKYDIYVVKLVSLCLVDFLKYELILDKC